jgi:hypothetical protein
MVGADGLAGIDTEFLEHAADTPLSRQVVFLERIERGRLPLLDPIK